MEIDLNNAPTGNPAKAPVGVIYGQAGLGKTTLVCQAPDVLVIDAERGMPPALVGVKRFEASTFNDVLALLQAVYEQDHSYKTVVIDSITKIINMLTDEICREQGWLLPNGKNDMGERGYGSYGRGDKAMAQRIAEIMNWVMAIREARNIAFILTGHVRVEKMTPPDGEQYTRYSLSAPALATEAIVQNADFVGFLSHPVTVIKDEDKKKGGAVRAMSAGSRRLYLRHRPAAAAKNRFDAPEYISIPDGDALKGWNELAAYIPYYSQGGVQLQTAVQTHDEQQYETA